MTDSLEQALELAPSFLAGRPSDAPALVVEERLEGREASVIAICDGSRAVALPAARDHKRLCDGDRGPNTGGMGAYSPLPDLDDAAVERILETVHRPILAEMARRGTPFRGFLYAGLMLTARRPGAPRVQRPARRSRGPGDPAAGRRARSGRCSSPPPAAAFRRTVRPLVPTLPAARPSGSSWRRRATRARRSAAIPIDGLEAAAATGALVFHAGTVARPGGGYGTNGGRVLTVVGRGTGLAEAREAAEQAADAIRWDGLQRRHDIGSDLPVPAGAAR